MSDRRAFLKASGIIALGSVVLPKWAEADPLAFAAKFPPVGLQVYTINFLLNSAG